MFVFSFQLRKSSTESEKPYISGELDDDFNDESIFDQPTPVSSPAETVVPDIQMDLDSKIKAHRSPISLNTCDNNNKSLSVLSSPPPKTPDMSSPQCSPPYVANIIPVNDNYNERTIDEELINESQTILRHCNESTSSDSSLSESTSPIANSTDFNDIPSVSLPSKLPDIKLDKTTSSLSPMELKSDNHTEDNTIPALEITNLKSDIKENEISKNSVNFVKNDNSFEISPVTIKSEELTEEVVEEKPFPALISETERKNEDDLAVISLLETMNDKPATHNHHGSCYLNTSDEEDDLSENNLLVDDQELQAAVQEIKFASQNVLVLNEVTVTTSDDVPEEVSVSTEIVYNDDDDNIEHELVVDETVINKSPDVISINEDTEIDDQVEVNINPSVEFLEVTSETTTITITDDNSDVDNNNDIKESTEQCATASDISIDNELKIVSPDQMDCDKTEDSVILIEDIVTEKSLEICTEEEIVLPTTETAGDQNETEKVIETEVKMEDNECDKTETIVEIKANECAVKEILDNDEKLIEDESKVKRVLVDSEIESEIQPKSKRGRKAKNRKNSDSSLHSPRNEPNTSNEIMTALSINTNLPSCNAILSPTSQSPGSSILSDVSPGSQNKRNKQQQQQPQHPYNVRRSVRTAAASSYVNSNLLEEMYDNADLEEQPLKEDHEEDSKNIVKKASKRGRKKKNANNHPINATNLSLTEIIVTKFDETIKKPYLDALAGNRSKSSTSPYDVFEFTDEEDIQFDNIKPPHFMSSISDDKHHFDKRHPIDTVNTDNLGKF